MWIAAESLQDALVSFKRFRIAFAALFLAASAVLAGQNSFDAHSRRPTATTTTEEQQAELDRHRTIIMDSPVGSKSRRLMAESLLELDIPARIDLAVELLAPDGAPLAICEAISTVGVKRPAKLDARLVDPLLDLLGNERTILSTQAASALSAFRDGDVADRLGALASDEKRPITARVAAVDALALNTDRREVVNVLIQLMRQSDDTIVATALAAVRQASRVDYGDDVRKWQHWWIRKNQLSDKVWLRDRLDLAALHNHQLRAEIHDLQQRSAARRQLVATRIAELLRKTYQLTPQGQREATLQQWLADSMEEYRLFALRVVRERIAEGDTPGESVRAAVKACFADPAPPVRIAALEIVGNLKDPNDAEAVLASLENETDPTARETTLRVLGRLENPKAIGALVEELTSPESRLGCVRESANALGVLGGQGHVEAQAMAPAIEPLRKRFAEAPDENLRLKESLLGAMALIGDRAFRPEFIANLKSDSPELLLAAIRGAEIVEARDQLDRLLDLLNHSDPRVRQLAAKAVGTLGSDPVHLAGLITRLNPDSEDNEGVRNAAWNGFRAILFREFRNPPSKLLELVGRLDRLPERQISLLEEILAEWSSTSSAPADVMTAARDQLADLLLSENKYADAVPHLQQLWKDYVAAKDDRAAPTRLKLVRACLYGARHERIVEIIIEIASPANDAEKAEIAQTVLDHLESALPNGDTEALRSLVKSLRAIPEGLLGSDWPQRLQDLSDRIPPAGN